MEDETMSDALMGLYERMKKALADAGGYEALDDEQRDLFNNATDALMGAKFEHTGMEETEAAVTAFLDAMAPEAEPLPEGEGEGPLPELTDTASLIRAADALDRLGQRELAAVLDAILLKMAKRA
jgi:hypothetical protein